MGIGVPSKLSDYKLLTVVKEFNEIKKDILATHENKYYILHVSEQNPFFVEEISYEEAKKFF